jgi:hypothetical protein
MQTPMWTLVAVLAVLAVSVSAHAATIDTLDFEELQSDADSLVGPVYSAEGMTLTALPPPQAPNTASDVFSVGTRSASFAGSTSVYHHISTGEIALTRADGDVFQLLPIDLAELPSFDQSGPINFGPFRVTFTGVRKNGKTVTATATVNPFPAMTTFTFQGFTNLTSVHWFQGAGGGPGLSTHQFDNVVVRLP